MLYPVTTVVITRGKGKSKPDRWALKFFEPDSCFACFPLTNSTVIWAARTFSGCMPYLPSYRLKLYRNFKAIGAADYHGIVRYFEQFEEAINTLDPEEYFDCALAYTNALFETGNLGQHVVMSDHLLELVIMQNIETWGGEDVYRQLLLKKSISLYKLQEYTRSEHILRELIKINPRDPWPVSMLRKCLLRHKPAWLWRSRAATMALTFLSVAAIALELFVVRPFFLDYYEDALWVHNILLGAAVMVLTAGETGHFWQCHRSANNFAKNMRSRENNP